MIPLSLDGRGRGPLGAAEWEGEGVSLASLPLTLLRLVAEASHRSPTRGEGR